MQSAGTDQDDNDDEESKCLRAVEGKQKNLWLANQSRYQICNLFYCSEIRSFPALISEFCFVIVFHEDFGENIGIGDALDSGTTSYTYSTIFPNEGEYTICNNT